MFWLILLSAFLINLASTNELPISAHENDIITEVELIDEGKLNELKNEATRMKGENAVAEKLIIYYTAGHPQPGDRVVGQVAQSFSYTTYQNVLLTIRYPKVGIGAIVTYVSCTVNQNSPYGQSYITGGGINQRWISLNIVASYVSSFSYNCVVRGK